MFVFLKEMEKKSISDKKSVENSHASQNVWKAFLIKGGTLKDREEKCAQLIDEDALHTYLSLEKGEETILVFCKMSTPTIPYKSLKGITFEGAKQLAEIIDLSPKIRLGASFS